mmetsp:Transcript_121670/g.234639  ORF Transcript_121670/g.234639 Transcript_121670/m.234639 type:complete len:1500 (-) Transcript_121670:43-4542(-)
MMNEDQDYISRSADPLASDPSKIKGVPLHYLDSRPSQKSGFKKKPTDKLGSAQVDEKPVEPDGMRKRVSTRSNVAARESSPSASPNGNSPKPQLHRDRLTPGPRLGSKRAPEPTDMSLKPPDSRQGSKARGKSPTDISLKQGASKPRVTLKASQSPQRGTPKVSSNSDAADATAVPCKTFTAPPRKASGGNAFGSSRSKVGSPKKAMPPSPGLLAGSEEAISDDSEKQPVADMLPGSDLNALAANQLTLQERLIRDLKNQDPSAMATLNKALAEASQPIHSVKLCFVGHARAGKTSTLLALVGRDFNPAQPSTHGVDTCSITQEMVEAPTADGSPWKQLPDGLSSVSDLWERSFARTAAKQLLAKDEADQAAERAGCDVPEIPEVPGKEQEIPETEHPKAERQSQESEDSGPTKPAQHKIEASPEVTKMPVDLVAQAVRGDKEEPGREPVVMETWDFAGQEMYYSMAHVFVTSLGIYALCLDLSQWATPWGSLSGPSKELVDSVEFWLSAILVNAPEARLVIVGTHDDELAEAMRPTVHSRINEQLAGLLERMPSLHQKLHVNEPQQLLFFPVDNSQSSPKGQESVDHLRDALNGLAREAAGELGNIPSRWAHFFHVLDGLEKPCITLEESLELARPLGLSADDLEGCFSLFHGLGQLLYYPGSPAVVLDPAWLLDAMAHVVACPRVLQKQWRACSALQERGQLSSDLLSVLWAEPQFRDYQATLLAFLEHFDLLVPSVLETTGSPTAAPAGNAMAQWLVPSLVPKRTSLKTIPACLSPAAAEGPGQRVVVYLDFHGALKKLLPSLLPRLLCHLRCQEELALKAFEIYQDFACFSLGKHQTVITVDIERRMTTDVVRVAARCLPNRQASLALQDVLEAITKALLAWMPRLSFSVKLPCPICCAGDKGEKIGGQLLDLEEVIKGDVLLCPQTQTILEDHLPEVVREWRCMERGALSPKVGSHEHKDIEGNIRMHFLYASPIGYRVQGGMQGLDQLDILAEVQALRNIAGLSPQVSVVTADTLREALVDQNGCSVMHLSAHCSLFPRPVLLLEDECSLAHPVDEELLATLGPWDREDLVLVFLACGSELLVRSLIRQCGLQCAICCSGEVFDAAARLFCRAFYHALAARHAVAVCHRLAQNALRSSANPGLRSEADKFLLLGCTPDAPRAVSVSRAVPSSWPRWPLWPHVEDFTGRVMETLAVAACFRTRRVLLLWGAPGVGKTAVCREFCRHFSAPGGRFFSSGVFWIDSAALESKTLTGSHSSHQEVFARAVLSEIFARGVQGELPAAAEPCWPVLRSVMQKLDEAGRWLLVIDNLQVSDGESTERDETLAQAFESLLSSSARVCLLFTTRNAPRKSSWATLASAKVNCLEVPALAPQAASKLFLRRVRRPLYPRDFDPTAPGAKDPGGSVPLQMSQQPGGLLDRLAGCPLLHALGNIPGRIVEAAAKVDETLPSLLEHEALPTPWRASASPAESSPDDAADDELTMSAKFLSQHSLTE